ncbi:FadR/GntR family transcriptional regulator [Amycolatopsis panacis]|nr:FCD domain-containing protein [Amycolatopsis panacis]
MATVEQSLRTLLAEGTQDGSLTAGSKLPTERELVARLAAPRSAIRRALEVLEGDGVIIRHVGRGTFLTETALQQVNGAPADTSPAEIMQVRLLLEPQIATLTARIATSVDLEEIGHCLTQGGGADTFEGFESWDARLHRSIAQGAHNGLLMNMFDVLNTARALPVWGSLKRRTSTPERRRAYHEEHTAIVDALRDRDPDGAATAMRQHLEHVSDTLIGRH